MIRPVDNPRWPGRRTEASALFLILLVAAAFRLYQIDRIPPGFTHDEADHGRDAVAILHGARPIYETVGYGREPLYDYAVAALMPIFGANYLALRLTSVLAGLLLIVIAHFWIRRSFDVPIALLTSAFLAVSFWAISTDRQALRSALLPPLFMAAVLFAWQAIKPHTVQLLSRPARLVTQTVSYFFAGLFIGLSLYTYLAARVLPGIFVLLWLYLLIFHRSVWKENWWGILGMIAIGIALALPMFYFLATHPGLEFRVTQLSGPIDQLVAGKPDEIVGNILGALGMFTVSGDTLWLYNNPGQPLLNWALGGMFYLGLIISFTRFRKIEYAFAIFWLLVAILPSMLTGVTASSLRSIAAQPVVYLFAAIGSVEAVRFFERVIDSHTLRSLPLIALLTATTIYAYHDYFDVWGQARDVRVAYHNTLAEVARYLD
ncbi:MAG TPA: glycosyltransferase family 39 protein, partial [Anaerolineae bacterium]|nr:glycosyltransferase family 39 protein [Anaerolineae bacterium]